MAFIFTSAIAVAVLYAIDMTVCSSGFGLPIETGVSVFYISLVLLLCIPKLPFSDSLHNVWRLLKLCFFPGSTISFSEVLMTDALTSLSKVLKDLGTTAVAVYAFISSTNILEFHNQAMIIIALLASLPYW
jgi:hypothetical protein